MSLILALFAYDPSTNPLNNSEWAFPIVEIFHIAAFALAIGTIAIVDFSVLIAPQKYSAPKLLKEVAPWTLAGLVVVLISGPIIVTTDPVMYYYNPGFRFKMAALALALIYNYTIHNRVLRSSPSGGIGKVVATVSLALWISVVFGGIFIAFT